MARHSNPVYPYRRSPDQDREAHHQAVVVGAGPVGLVAAVDLALQGVQVLLLDDDQTVSVGSRAICYAKRTLEILDRLGCGQAVLREGVRWSVGKVYHRGALVYQFDLQPEPGHQHPAFVNLPQYHLEQILVERLAELPAAEIRGLNQVTGVRLESEGVALSVDTPEGPYRLTCDWLIVADGAKSPVRSLLGIEMEGQVFHDHFLIVDVRMKSQFPVERRFWFDPPFHPNHSALMHRQEGDLWRIDFQLGTDANADAEKRPESIMPRLRAMLGEGVEFEIEWASVYTFQCRRMKHFRHQRVLFAGDAAHVVSPFGARGANGGMQDADNLAWKLKLVMDGRAPQVLLDSYDIERVAAADESIRATVRSTEFITPKSPASRTFRDATLALARQHAFARKLVDSGRLSVPTVLADSPLNTADRDRFAGAMAPGAPAADAPLRAPENAWLLDHLRSGFTLLAFGDAVSSAAAARLHRHRIGCRVVQVTDTSTASRSDRDVIAADSTRFLIDRYDAQPGTCYLFRPDQHVCARWRAFDVGAVQAALDRATANATAA